MSAMTDLDSTSMSTTNDCMASQKSKSASLQRPTTSKTTATSSRMHLSMLLAMVSLLAEQVIAPPLPPRAFPDGSLVHSLPQDSSFTDYVPLETFDGGMVGDYNTHAFLWYKKAAAPGKTPYGEGVCQFSLVMSTRDPRYDDNNIHLMPTLAMCPNSRSMAALLIGEDTILVYVMPTGQLAFYVLEIRQLFKGPHYNGTYTDVDLRKVQYMTNLPGSPNLLIITSDNRWSYFSLFVNNYPKLITTGFLIHDADGQAITDTVDVLDAKIDFAAPNGLVLVLRYRVGNSSVFTFIGGVADEVTQLGIINDNIHDIDNYFIKDGFVFFTAVHNGINVLPIGVSKFLLGSIAIPNPGPDMLTMSDANTIDVPYRLKMYSASYYPFALIFRPEQPSHLFRVLDTSDPANFGDMGSDSDYEMLILEYAYDASETYKYTPPVDSRAPIRLFDNSGRYGFTYQSNLNEDRQKSYDLFFTIVNGYIKRETKPFEPVASLIPPGFRTDRFFYVESCRVANCESCINDREICTGCTSPYSLFGNTCVDETACPRGCVCLAPGACSSCQIGYINAAGNTQCETCDFSNGYRLIDGFCQKCDISNCESCSIVSPGNCATCQRNYTGVTCSSCATGYIYDSVTGRCVYSCSASFPKCDFCNRDSQDGIFDCGRCKSGFMGIGADCEICEFGTYLVSSGDSCQPLCPARCTGGCDERGVCKECAVSWTGPKCDSCDSGYYYEAGVCVPHCDIDNCLAGCEFPRTCRSCDDHYNTTANVTCTVCKRGFDILDDCQSCITGDYLINDDGDVCEPICNVNCLPGFCAEPHQCTDCYPGYGGFECDPICTGKCTGDCIAPENCGGQCEYPWVGDGCLECDSEHYLSEGVCLWKCDEVISERCLPGCNNAANVCDQCSTGYTGPTCALCDTYYHYDVDNYTCIPDCGIFRCIDDVCFEPFACFECQTGYTGHKCEVCSPLYLRDDNQECTYCNVDLCAKCNTPNVCAQCEEGSYLAADGSGCYPIEEVCRPTLPHCEICTNVTTCMMCRENYYLSENKTRCQTLNESCPIQYCSKCEKENTCFTCTDGRVPSADGSACIYPCTIENCASCDVNGKCMLCQGDFVLAIDGLSCLPLQDVDPNVYSSDYDPQASQAVVDFSQDVATFNLKAFVFEIKDDISGELFPCDDCYAEVIPGLEKSLKFYVVSDLQLLSATLVVSYSTSSLRGIVTRSRLLQNSTNNPSFTVPDVRLSGKKSSADTSASDAFIAINAIRFFATVLLSITNAPQAFWSTYQYSWLQLWSLLRGPFLAYPDRLLQWHMKWYLVVINWGEPFVKNWDDWSKVTKCRADKEYPMNKLGCNFTDNFGQNFVVIFLVFFFCMLVTAVIFVRSLITKRNQTKSKGSQAQQSWLDKILTAWGYMYFLRWMVAIQPSVVYFSLLQFYTYFYTPRMAFGAVLAIFFMLFYTLIAICTGILARRIWTTLENRTDLALTHGLEPLAKIVGGKFLGTFAFQFNDMKRVTAMWQLLYPLAEFFRTILISIVMIALGEGPLASLGCVLAFELLRLIYLASLFRYKYRVFYAVQDLLSGLLFVLYVILKITTADLRANEETSQKKTGLAMAIFVGITWGLCLLNIVHESVYAIASIVRPDPPKHEHHLEQIDTKVN